MKIKSLFRLPVLLGLVLGAGSVTSCMTTYDANGRPVQSVDPGLAVAGVAAAGLIGYAAANNHGHDNHYYGGNRYYRGGGHYYGGHGRRRGGYHP
jgi:hypothetical protein